MSPRERQAACRSGNVVRQRLRLLRALLPFAPTFLTGQYAHNHGVLSNKAPYGSYYALDSSNTLPVWLKRAGYETILVGKYLNGYGDQDKREIPPGWTEWHGAVNNSAYQFYGYTLNENGKLEVRAGPSVVPVGRLRGQGRRGRAPPRSGEAPVLLWVSFLATSGGPPTPGRSALTTLPAPRHLGRFAASPLPTPPSFNEEDVSDKPGSIRNRAPLSEQQVTAITERYQLRLESLLAVDESAGSSLRSRRRASCHARSSSSSDNGFMQGEHRIPIGKQRVYEPSTRVPLVMRGPGIPAGLHAASRWPTSISRPRSLRRRARARPADGRTPAVAAACRPGHLLGTRPPPRGAAGRGCPDEVLGSPDPRAGSTCAT